MPLERFGNPSEGVAQGINSLGQVLAQMPRIRAQAGLVRAQTGRETALAGEATEHGNLYKQLGLKSADELAAAQAVAGEFQNVQKNADGSVTIPADSLGRIAGLLARTGKGANDIGGGIQKLFGTANAPVEQGFNRENKIDVARVKPIVLNPNQTAISNEPSVEGVDVETGDPSATQGIGSVIAQAPPAPQMPSKALPDYTTTTIRDERNPAYNIAEGATNVPPVIKMTNTVSRASGAAKPQSQTAPQGDAFDSEQSARAAGHGPGSVITIKGVGKVRLR